MPRQIASGLSEPSIALLEERIHRLEVSVALLTHAVQVLAREVTGSREPEPGEAPERATPPDDAAVPATAPDETPVRATAPDEMPVRATPPDDLAVPATTPAARRYTRRQRASQKE
ncbi:hypothetical protein GCM10023195_70610 [Actinoallomurus liliacearum]|uniref:Uncharacterized protein n=1 Tax=Actinoallomurus liliacearum TaxID=1080073 RepID=A0ABP8TVM7_9ACTN